MRSPWIACLAAGFTALAVTPVRAGEIESSGSMTWEPAAGSVYAGIWLQTDGPCAEEATNVYARLTGPGFDSAGMVVIPNAAVGVSTSEPMILPLQDNLYNFAQRANLQRLDGNYTLDVICTDEFGVETLTKYSSTVAISQGENEPLDTATYETGPNVEADEGGSNTGQWAASGAAVMVAAGAAVFLVQRRRRASAEASG